MEKTRGVPLAEKWNTLNTMQRYRLIDKILEMETALQRLQFPAYGGLFLRETLPSSYPRYPLSSGLDPNNQFCIGPSVDLSYTASADLSGQNAGPCEYFIFSFAVGSDNVKGHRFWSSHSLHHVENWLEL